MSQKKIKEMEENGRFWRTLAPEVNEKRQSRSCHQKRNVVRLNGSRSSRLLPLQPADLQTATEVGTYARSRGRDSANGLCPRSGPGTGLRRRWPVSHVEMVQVVRSRCKVKARSSPTPPEPDSGSAVNLETQRWRMTRSHVPSSDRERQDRQPAPPPRDPGEKGNSRRRKHLHPKNLTISSPGDCILPI